MQSSHNIIDSMYFFLCAKYFKHIVLFNPPIKTIKLVQFLIPFDKFLKNRLKKVNQVSQGHIAYINGNIGFNPRSMQFQSLTP